MPAPDPSPREPHWLLRRSDQATVAGFLALGLVSLLVWSISRGGLTGRMVEIDRAPPLSAAFQVDINQADWPELAQLPDIGETLARRIVESRQSDGPFLDHDELRRVRGIGPKTLERLRPYLLPMAEAEALVQR